MANILPPGFDPATGKFRNISTFSYTNPTTSSYTNTRVKTGIWNQCDNAIRSIGNFIDDQAAGIITFIIYAIGLAGLIAVIVWVFKMFSDGFFWGLLSIAGAFFIIGIGYYAVCIVGWIIGIAIYAVRFMFFNLTSLLITVAIIGLLIGYNIYNIHNTYNQTRNSTQTTVSVPQTTQYQCTAQVLNVRSGPSKYSAVLGTIKHNDIVEVYEITNGFAKIKYKSNVGYASIEYLKRRGYN